MLIYLSSIFGIIKLEKPLTNDIQFLSPQSTFLFSIARMPFSYHARKFQILFLKKVHSRSPLKKSLLGSWMSYFLQSNHELCSNLNHSMCHRCGMHECIKEYLLSIHYEMESSVLPILLCNTGSQGLALQSCSTLSRFGLKSVLLDIAEQKVGFK